MRDDYAKGETVKGHFCLDCLPSVDPAERSPQNPAKNALCIKCGHFKEGLNSTGLVGDWLVIGRSKQTPVEPTTPPAPDPRDGLRDAYISGYSRGHDDTVESRYVPPEIAADEYIATRKEQKA